MKVALLRTYEEILIVFATKGILRYQLGLMLAAPYEALTFVYTQAKAKYGGEGEIRTHDTGKGILAFETSAFGHSATSPFFFFAVVASRPS